MKRCAIYCRVSTVDQHPETQRLDLEKLAEQRGLEIVARFTDYATGAKARRPELEKMMAAARRGQFEVLLAWAGDRLARNTRDFLQILDELNHLGIEYISFRESIDTGGPLGRAIVVIIGTVAELERNLIVERVRAGMRRARLEGRHIGRKPLDVDRTAILRDRRAGLSLGQLARAYSISRSSVARVIKEAGAEPVPKGVPPAPPQVHENKPPKSAA